MAKSFFSFSSVLAFKENIEDILPRLRYTNCLKTICFVDFRGEVTNFLRPCALKVRFWNWGFSSAQKSLHPTYSVLVSDKGAANKAENVAMNCLLSSIIGL